MLELLLFSVCHLLHLSHGGQWQVQDATNTGLRGWCHPAMQKGSGTLNLGGVLVYLIQASWSLNYLLCICCIIHWVPFAHTCKEHEPVALPQISYTILAPTVPSYSPPKDRLPCYFQGKYVYPWLQNCPWMKRTQPTSGEAGSCPAAVAEWVEIIPKGHGNSSSIKVLLVTVNKEPPCYPQVFTCPGGHCWTLLLWLPLWRGHHRHGAFPVWSTEAFRDWHGAVSGEV